MNIWLINPYGPIPGEGWRDYRFSIIAEELATKGHNVVWWTSAFSHHFKTHRSKVVKDLKLGENNIIRLIPTPGYTRNISLGRIWRDLVFSYKVFKLGRKSKDRPHLIIYYESPLCFGFAGYKLAKLFKVPVIFDQMDLWPELIVEAFSKKSQPFIKMLLNPVFVNRKKIYDNLDGFMALARPYLDIPLSISYKLKTKPNVVIYNGIDVDKFCSSIHSIENLPPKKAEDIWLVFAGTLGPTYDIVNIIEVSRKFVGSDVKFIIAGDGPLKGQILEEKNNDALFYIGKLKPEQLNFLYRSCDIGLSAYTEKSNVEMPDKFYDYTAAGLPIINSLKGEVYNWIADAQIGLNYDGGSLDDLYKKINLIIKRRDVIVEMARRSKELGKKFDQRNQITELIPFVNRVMINGSN